jgi:hypothetical protein
MMQPRFRDRVMSTIKILHTRRKRTIMKRHLFTTAISLALFGGLLVPNIRADEWDKMTTVTFSGPVQVSGTVLPAGTYVFKLLNSESDRDVVQIFNAEETRLITTAMALPDYRATISDKSSFAFEERPSGQPEALKAWFYPGDEYGEEFLNNK